VGKGEDTVKVISKVECNQSGIGRVVGNCDGRYILCGKFLLVDGIIVRLVKVLSFILFNLGIISEYK
jgi:hypothetical protein